MHPLFPKIWFVLLCLCVSFVVAAQDRLLVGAYDPAHVNGVVMIAENGTNAPTAFGLRVLVYRPEAKLEIAPPLERVRLLGPVATDGTYARVHWDSPFEQRPLTLQWTRVGPRLIVGQISTRVAVNIALETYRPFAQASGALNFRAADEETLFGEQLTKSRTPLRFTRFVLRTDRKAGGAASYVDAAKQHALMVQAGQAHNEAGDTTHPYGALTFALKEKESVGFVMVIGDDYDALEKEADEALRQPVAQTLLAAETRFDNARMRADGWLDDGLAALSRAVQWNRFYWPERQSDFAGSLRLSGATAELPQAIGTDAFFRILAAAWIDPAHAQDTLKALLAEQAPDGRIAPQRLSFTDYTVRSFNGRTLAPLGALTAWKVYQATRDLQFLANVYPRLKRWHEWWLNDRGDGKAWRDGNGDGLIEWGYDAELEVGELSARRMSAVAQGRFALAQTGTAESPQWPPLVEEPKTEVAALNPQELPPAGHAPLANGMRFNLKAHTLEITPVGLNALYALDAEMLLQIARELGMAADAQRWEAHYLRLKQLIDEKLWSEADQLYLNRHWGGTFVRRFTPESFYALTAGVAAPERARLMLAPLRDPNRFGGQLGLPSLARNDAAFNPAERWRGAIVAEANYLTYLGFKHYSFYAEAAALAQQSAALARESWQQSNKVYDTYAAIPGIIAPVPTPREADASSSYGALFWLVGLEELLSFDPWSGWTMGNESVTAQASLQRLPFGDAAYSIHLAPERLTIKRGEISEIEIEPAARLLNYRSNERTISFFVESSRPLTLRIPSAENRPVSISVDNKLLGDALVGPAARVNLSAGIHRIVIVK